MQAVLTRLGDGEHVASIIIRPGFRVVVGSNPASEFCIEDEGLAGRHFSLAFEEQSLRIQNLASNGQRLWIDGRVETNRVIGHDARVRAGNVEFLVTVDIPLTLTTTWELALPSRLELQRKLCKGGIKLLRLGPVDTEWAGLITKMAAGRSLILAINQRAAPVQNSFVLSPEQDLFAFAPPEVRQAHSLHLLPISTNQWLDQAEFIKAVLAADAGMLLISSKALPDLTTSKRIYWAWFAKPSLLRFQVTEGSDNLARQLIADIELIILSFDSSRWISILGPINAIDAIDADLTAEQT